jgi:sugar phosphate isomerase/epimerase
MGPDDLVLCSGTLRGGIPFAERLSAAAGAGFTAVSMWGRDHAAARAEGLTDADMRLMLADHGLAMAELDPAWWWLPGASEIHIAPERDSEDVFRFGESELFDIAEALGGRSVNAAEAFAGLCQRAAERGLLVHIEWLPWSKISDLDSALEIVRLAGQPNGGINVDAWHFVRTNTDLEAIRNVPGFLIIGIQLDDGPLEPEPNLVEATLHHRALPGDGEFDLAGIVKALFATGTTAPIGVEVFSDVLHELPSEEAALRAGRATRQLIESISRPLL